MNVLKEGLAALILLPRFLVTVLVLLLLDILCIRKWMLSRQQSEENADDPPICVSDTNRMFTFESLKAIWHGQKLDFFKSAHVGSPAPNPEVVELEGHRRVRLLDFNQDARPLVLNFGSCT